MIGLILGPLAETQFRRALAISQGDTSVICDIFEFGIYAVVAIGAGRRLGSRGVRIASPGRT